MLVGSGGERISVAATRAYGTSVLSIDVGTRPIDPSTR
jgi:hypothetical protein